MKMGISRFLLIFAVVFMFSSKVLSQRAIELQYPLYSVTVFSQLRSGEEMKPAPFMAARQRTAQKKDLRPFGVYCQGKAEPNATQTVLEILDVEKNVSIKKVSVNEYFGKETAGWKTIGAESKATAEKIVSAFQVHAGTYSFKFIRDIAVSEDRNLPLGKKLYAVFSLESNTPLKLRVKFFGRAEGRWKHLGKSLLISDHDTLSRVHPTLVFHPLQGSTIDVTRPSKQGAASNFTVTSKTTSLTAKTPTIIFAVEMAGTTISFDEHIAQQAENLSTYFDSHIGKPAIVAVSQASKATTRPGDTLMFLLYSHNIGTAPAVENTLNNIIPAGTLYVEGTAEGKGSDIAYTRLGVEPPLANPVSNITWKYKDPIYPGEERIASFSVVIQ